MPIQSGILAPDFELSDETGVMRKLSDFREKFESDCAPVTYRLAVQA